MPTSIYLLQTSKSIHPYCDDLSLREKSLADDRAIRKQRFKVGATKIADSSRASVKFCRCNQYFPRVSLPSFNTPSDLISSLFPKTCLLNFLPINKISFGVISLSYH